MDKFGHEPLHYPDEVQPDKHRRERGPKPATTKKPRRLARSPERKADKD